METSEAPPSRKSISITGTVKPIGPHHFLTISGSAKAFHTPLIGASRTRVTIRSYVFGVPLRDFSMFDLSPGMAVETVKSAMETPAAKPRKKPIDPHVY
jgi:hypothetical protein